jgi:hypothetical protein
MELRVPETFANLQQCMFGFAGLQGCRIRRHPAMEGAVGKLTVFVWDMCDVTGIEFVWRLTAPDGC